MAEKADPLSPVICWYFLIEERCSGNYVPPSAHEYPNAKYERRGHSEGEGFQSRVAFSE